MRYVIKACLLACLCVPAAAQEGTPSSAADEHRAAPAPAAQPPRGQTLPAPRASGSSPALSYEEVLALLTKNEVEARREEYRKLCTPQGESANNLDVKVLKNADAEGNRRYRFQTNASPSRVSVSNASTSTTVERLAAAIDANLQGVTAGISVAPFALAAADTFGDAGRYLDGLTLSVASMDDRSTRIGAGYTVLFAWEPSAADYQAATRELYCGQDGSVKDEPLDKLWGAILPRAEDFGRVCSQWLPQWDTDERARAYCLGGPDLKSFSMGYTIIEQAIAATVNKAKAELKTSTGTDQAKAQEKLRRLEALKTKTSEALARLETASNAGIPRFSSTQQAVKWYVANKWDRLSAKLAVDLSLALAPRISGFRPLTKETAGEPPVVEQRPKLLPEQKAKASLQFKFQRLEIVPGIGFGFESTPGMDDKNDDPLAFAEPSIALSVAVAALDGKPLVENGKVRLEDDYDLPPHVAFGTEISAHVGLFPSKRPDFQSPKNLHEFEAQLFADFKLSKTSTIRLGVPIRGRLVLQKKNDETDPPIAKKSALQWDVPVFVGTVLAM